MREPDITGVAARAWKVAAQSGGPADWAGSVASYLVNGDGFHPMWTWWLVGVVHLRPIEGVRPAAKHYEGAEHEFMIASINPDHPPDPDNPAGGFHLLEPLDVVVQFDGLNDDQAAHLCMMAASLICRGKASPDQDHRAWWHAAIRNSVEHELMGGHPERGQG